MNECIILIGGGGHAKVVADCIFSCRKQITGILDDHLSAGSALFGIPVLGKISDYTHYQDHHFLLAIGSNRVRAQLSRTLPVQWCTIIHPSAIISPYASIGVGTVVMPRAVINAGAAVGAHCIINTGSIVEHDCRIEDCAHISPGASLGGTVHIGACTHIGIGACVRNNLSICSDCTVGAGAAVVQNIEQPGTYVGVPARRLI